MKINVYRKLPRRPTLRDNQIDVWYWTVDQLATLHYEWERLISRREQQRASRFHSQQQSDNYVLTRGMVRYLLSRYLRQEPEDLFLRVDAANTLHLYDSDLRFDFAWAENVTTIAVAQNMDVGIQVEAMDDLPDLDVLARFMLNSAELHHYNKLRRCHKLPAFYNLWTRKSALCQVAHMPTTHFNQLNVWKDNTTHRDAVNATLYVQSLDLLPRYSGAVAYGLSTTA